MGREQQYLELGELAARRLREQLDHLADAVRLHHRKRGALLSPVKFAPLLDALHQENADLARERGLTVRICPTRTVIMSDATLLHSILYNLIRNAIKYTPKGGRILVGCRGSGPNVRIEVRIPVLAYRPPIICRKSSMRFIAWIRLNPMAWVSDCSWFDGQRICSAITSGSDPQSGAGHVFRSWPEQDEQQIGLAKLSKSRSTTGLRRCSPV
jgi:hypothetical protein